MLDKYKIEDTSYIHPPKEFLNENFFQNFQPELNNFKILYLLIMLVT